MPKYVVVLKTKKQISSNKFTKDLPQDYPMSCIEVESKSKKPLETRYPDAHQILTVEEYNSFKAEQDERAAVGIRKLKEAVVFQNQVLKKGYLKARWDRLFNNKDFSEE